MNKFGFLDLGVVDFKLPTMSLVSLSIGLNIHHGKRARSLVMLRQNQVINIWIKL